jgi:hypothetical protein
VTTSSITVHDPSAHNTERRVRLSQDLDHLECVGLGPAFSRTSTHSTSALIERPIIAQVARQANAVGDRVMS